MTRTLLACSLALVLIVPASAQAAAKPNLRVVRVDAPGYAHPGGTLPVRVTAVAGKRRAKAAKLRVYLSSDRKRSKGDIVLKASERLPKLKRRARGEALALVALPQTAAAGSRYVIACAVRGTCRPAKRRLTITAEADPSKTSAALIEADRAAGRISDEKALTYRVFAIFGDSRLPARYSGDMSAEEDDGAMREAAEAWPRLSTRAKSRIAPYLAPPPLRNRASASANADPCVTDEDYKPHGWDSIPAAGGKVRINWRTDRPETGKDAAAFARDVTTAYKRFTEIMGRGPLSDAKVGCWHGKDGAVDIYLDRVYNAEAITVPAAKTKYTTPDCDGMPSFIVANPTSQSFSMRFVLAHELFHTFQNAFPYQAGCKEYEWFDEASANWAAHSAFPADDGEHFFDQLLSGPETRLAWRDYHAWPFVLWMEKTLGERSVRSVYETFKTKESEAAVDQVIGGFRNKYLDFAKNAWNQDPFPAFRGWDGFEPVPLGPGATQPQALFLLEGQRSRTATVPFELAELARGYEWYAIADDKVKEVVFSNPLANEPDARIGAILTLRSGETRFEDWSGKQRVSFCREQPSQDVTSLVIVEANSSLKDWSSISGAPELRLRDACDGFPWHFKVLDASHETQAIGSQPASADHYCGSSAGLPISGTTDFKAASSEDVWDPSNSVSVQPNGELAGEIGVGAPATFAYTLTGCAGSPLEYCETSLARGGGDHSIGFSLEAESKSAATATLSWWINNPEVGFVDTGDEVCNVPNIWHGLSSEKQKQEIPLERLAGTEPVTLTFDGSDSWNEDQYGDPATLNYGWSYSITLQRVDEDGGAL